uniref:Uncharacterized protein n=1 Tax=Arundo donax TaxID=35708 RepID=A0A0A9HKL0_ARUDO
MILEVYSCTGYKVRSFKRGTFGIVMVSNFLVLRDAQSFYFRANK